MLQRLTDETIRDTVAAVFRDPMYNRTSLLDRLGAWLLEVIEALFARFRPAGLSAPVFWTVVTMVGIVLIALTARVVRSLIRRRRFKTGLATELAGLRGPGDPWHSARLLADGGNYTAAAHALYAALLQSIALRGDVELHESKTIGDYLRDLSRRSSGFLTRFREFARAYETVIYGLGFCDRARYERLLGLAHQIAESRG